MKRYRLGGFLAALCMVFLRYAGAETAPARTRQDDKPAETSSEKSKKPGEKKKGLSLKPERTIEFTTDEGTWLSLDVSPDGKTILFELLGDLYTLPVEGGEAQRITSGMAFDSQPVYSPDGKMIAFLSDRDGAENLWIVKADGSEPKALSKDQHSDFASPYWTRDGEYILVSRKTPAAGARELWMYHVKGGSGVQITKAKPKPDTPNAQRVNAMGAVASPDSRYIYYARRSGLFSYNVTFPLWQIVRRDRTTGDEDVITQSVGSAFRPALSPDGRQMVYGTRYDAQTGLRLRDLASGEDHWLKYPVQRDDQESMASRDVLPGYAFMPDGQSIVVAYGGKIHRVSLADGKDQIIPFTAKVSQEIGPSLNFPERVDEGPVRARLIQTPSQSPDGKRLIFSSLTQLYVMDLPGGKPTRFIATQTRESQPAWSPDGEWVAYVTWSHTGGHIWKARANGQGAPQQLTRQSAFYRDLVWSPDGSRIVALRAPRQERLEAPTDLGGSLPELDVIWVPSDGGEAQLIAPARGVGRPHFSGERERVYVYSSQGLLSMRFDGTDRRTHIKVVGKSRGPEPTPAQDVRISPNGRQALALVNNQLYLVMIPMVGGEPPTVDVSSASVPIKKLTDVGADYFAWADRGATITWALGSTFSRLPMASVTFEPDKKKDGEEAEDDKGDSPKKSEERTQPADTKEAKSADKKLPIEEIEVIIERERHRPKGTVVLRGAKVITMHGDEVLSNADVVVTDNRIAGVGRRGSISVPAGARIMDVQGATIVPGFIDVHAHWLEIRRGVLDMQNWSFLANLAYGVTTGRDPQTMTNDMFAYQDLVDIGEMIGPRAFSTGPGVFASTDFQSAEDAKNTVAKYKKHYRTHTLKSYMVGNRKQRQWMVDACKEHKIMPTTEGGLDLKLDLTHVIDGFSGNEHSLPIVPLYKDVVEMFARSGIFYTPTLLVAYGGPWAENYFYETTEVHDDLKLRRFIPHHILDAKSRRRPWFRQDEHIFSKLAAEAAKIIRAGGRVGIGGHGQLQGIQVHWEIWALQSGGLSNMEALRAATLHGAEAIGHAQDLGSIEAGKLADLVVLAKDPLADIRNTNTIRYVMKNGELFDGNTLDQLWPRQKALESMWWWNDKP